MSNGAPQMFHPTLLPGLYSLCACADCTCTVVPGGWCTLYPGVTVPLVYLVYNFCTNPGGVAICLLYCIFLLAHLRLVDSTLYRNK